MVCNGIVAKIRADRRGSIGYATSSTIGCLYCILAMGFPDTSLVLAFGHATLRVIQMLRAVNYPLEYHQMTGIIEGEAAPKPVSVCWYRFAWKLNRMNTDVSLPQVLPVFQSILSYQSLELSKPYQYMMTALLVVVAGMPFSPLTSYNDQVMMALLHVHPCQAVALMALSVVISTTMFWLITAKVLHPVRFRQPLLAAKTGGEQQDVESLTKKVKQLEQSLADHAAAVAAISPVGKKEPLTVSLLDHDSLADHKMGA
eukprot:gnl/TRDRNA2_/TRDRNA2_166811_c6_seq1.p1 gnl/TRDRNA2_/TRDRNA2_166811_c6~~gnl/TRDRNA2_/TRDRNA2_166811_c6_seq1.p1  ORF type:complete len:291 (+),score=55.35 gnl/TRDRNA2_/TRDRNA2_166811_c6_seq1:105-875(+)